MDGSRDLTGKTAIVTGASSGIGRAIAESLAGAGAHVHLTGRSQAGLEAAAKSIEEGGGAVTLEPFDVRDLDRLQGFVEQTASRSSGLHVMVNNAGLSRPGNITDGDAEHWREMFDVNVIALLAGCQAAIRAMRAHGSEGHLVNISSIAGSLEGRGVYGASKAAVDNLASSLRQELENDPIRVVNIRPGMVATSFGRNYDPAVVKSVAASMGVEVDVEPGAHWPEELIERVQVAARQQFVSAADIARAVLYAVSQPSHVNVYDIVVRPQKSLSI